MNTVIAIVCAATAFLLGAWARPSRHDKDTSKEVIAGSAVLFAFTSMFADDGYR